MHQLRNSFGSLSPLPVSLFVSVWFFRSLTICLTLFLPLLLHVLIPTDSIFQCWCFPLQFNHFLLHVLSSSSLSRCSYFLPHSHTFSTCDFFFPSTCDVLCFDWTSPLQLRTSLPSVHWTASLLRPSLLAPTPLSPPLSLYLARRTSFPPWVLQTPVWKLKVEGEEER